MDLIPVIGAATAVTSAALMYLNAKFSIGSDIAQLYSGLKMQRHVKNLYRIHGEDDWSLYHVLHSTYEINNDTEQEALVFEGRSWTYRELREGIGRTAEAFGKLGVCNRTVVALFIDNSPEFIFTAWALYKLGAIPAPLNTSITGDHIQHCLKISEAEILITSHDLYPVLAQAFDLQDRALVLDQSSSTQSLRGVFLYDHNTYPRLASGAVATNVFWIDHDSLKSTGPDIGDFPKALRPKVGPSDASQYLFTSGTTGLPKALNWPSIYAHAGTYSKRWPGLGSSGKSRRFYVCLPMFHGTASSGAVAPTLASSGTVILARRFSRRNFWVDVRQSRANAIVYIGEMLRYLVQSPPDPRFPDEKNHELEVAFGLGLAPKIWQEFRERFGVPWIVEYYSSSEATTALVNSNKNSLGIGKVGRWGPLMRSLQKSFYIVRVNIESGDIYRDSITGYCQQTKPGEIGESICRIDPPLQSKHNYIGPQGKEDTEKKILRNVFTEGDEFFRLGDAMMIDIEGFISFQDRLGDTFRAKGHNISTTEVENCLLRRPEIASSNVYAIAMNVYGYEGQLGCAAITLRGDITSENAFEGEQKLVKELEDWITTNKNALPSYAVPRFLRILTLSEDTCKATQNLSTAKFENGAERVSSLMKKRKVELRKEAFTPPHESSDRMYWIKKEGSGYTPLTVETVQKIQSGMARL